MAFPFSGKKVGGEMRIFGIPQSVLGNRYANTFSSTLTNYGKNQTLILEEKLEGNLANLTNIGPGNWQGSISIDYTDQSKDTPPKIIGFLQQGVSPDFTLNQLPFMDFTVGLPSTLNTQMTLESTNKQAIVSIVSTGNITNIVVFIYVLADNLIT